MYTLETQKAAKILEIELEIRAFLVQSTSYYAGSNPNLLRHPGRAILLDLWPLKVFAPNRASGMHSISYKSLGQRYIAVCLTALLRYGFFGLKIPLFHLIKRSCTVFFFQPCRLKDFESPHSRETFDCIRLLSSGLPEHFRTWLGLNQNFILRPWKIYVKTWFRSVLMSILCLKLG